MDAITESSHLELTDRQRVLSILASSSGNLVEWFDFYVYAFTALYFAPAFFPQGNPTVQLVQAAAVFAIGFLMRPIGGWLFGSMADRYGRRRAMIISVLMMAFGSFVIACLPGYASIGVLAPLALLLARMLQGLSVGGEYGTTATYMSEVARAGRRGFFSSFQYVTLIGGQLAASVVILVLQWFLDDAALKSWGWRIPFAIGGASAIVALYLRRSLPETIVAGQAGAGSLMGMLRRSPRAFLIVLGFTAGGSLIFYTYTTYMQKYLVNTAHMEVRVANVIMTLALFCYMCMQPAFGALSDRIGRRTCMILFGALSALATIPSMHLIGGTQNPYVAFVILMIMMGVISLYTSISGIVKAELFPAQVRALGVGLAYAVANAIFGGSAEYVALSLKGAGHESWFFVYVTLMMVVVLVVALIMPDARRAGYLQSDKLD